MDFHCINHALQLFRVISEYKNDCIELSYRNKKKDYITDEHALSNKKQRRGIMLSKSEKVEEEKLLI